MVLFKLRLQQLRRKDYFIYIPLWFYSNVCKFWKRIILKRDLHSTMVLFKQNPMQVYITQDSIYIPLWFYSNEAYNSFGELINRFTFHYGSIQIRTTTQPQPLVQIYIPLWFYSNCITNVRAKLLFLDLHSTMVLFKYNLYYNAAY